MDIPTFRAALPAFTAATFPDPTVQFWLDIATNRLDPLRWLDNLPEGTLYFVAHNLVLGQQAAIAAEAGRLPGVGGGLMSSKSVGGDSASYDIGASTYAGGGAYNLTSFSVRFLQLAKMVGMGPIQF